MTIFTLENLKECFDLLEKCRGVLQDPRWHPERDVFCHSLQVMNRAFRESNDVDAILAAMLHDVGKPVDSKKHASKGALLIQEYTSAKTQWLVSQHMRVKLLLSGELKKRSKVLELSGHPWLPELVMLHRWDLAGRKPGVSPGYGREEIVSRLNRCCLAKYQEPVG